MSKQLAQGCYPVEQWYGQDVNPGPLGPSASALITMPLSHADSNMYLACSTCILFNLHILTVEILQVQNENLS